MNDAVKIIYHKIIMLRPRCSFYCLIPPSILIVMRSRWDLSLWISLWKAFFSMLSPLMLFFQFCRSLFSRYCARVWWKIAFAFEINKLKFLSSEFNWSSRREIWFFDIWVWIAEDTVMFKIKSFSLHFWKHFICSSAK